MLLGRANIWSMEQEKIGKERLIGGALIIWIISYAILFSGFFILDAGRYRLGDLFQASVNNKVYFLAVASLLLALIAYRYAVDKMKSFSLLFALALILYFSLSFVRPLLSSDVYSYIYQGRVWVIGGHNPYAFSYSNLTSDSFQVVLANIWSKRTTPYGPLFVLVEGFFAGLFRDNPISAIPILKLFFSACGLLTAFLIGRSSQSITAVFLFILNPLVIVETAVNGHNDAFFALLVVIATTLIADRGQCAAAAFFLALSILTKYLSLILLPIWLVFYWRSTPSPQKRFRFMLLFLAASSVFIAAAWVFRAEMVTVWHSVSEQAEQAGAFVSPLIAISRFLLHDSFQPVWIGRITFLLIYAWILVRMWRRPESEELVFCSFIALVALILCALSWMMPWYFITPIALAALLYAYPSHQSVAQASIYALTFYGIINYILLR